MAARHAEVPISVVTPLELVLENSGVDVPPDVEKPRHSEDGTG